MTMALGGIAVVMSSRGVGLGPGWQVGLVAGVIGALVFAVGGFVAACRFAGMPVLVVAAGQQLGAAALLVPAALLLVGSGLAPRPHPTAHAVVALLLLGVLGSGVAYLLFYWLIEHEGPVRTAVVNLVVPVSGVVWSAVLLGEPVGWSDAGGVVLTAAGVALVLRPAPLPEVP
ncbi:EamA family transporter [Nocardioides mangrovicus]|uniref:EamA family transporter n=2 Tax=Nocardioides mangrovicus TaxID=2478913 RepID=A0A3L8P4X6_9ACTN|nr:EamA family transporter [Nocardioides mangrovicus]